MTRSFARLIVLAFLGTGLIPLVTVTCSSLNLGPLSAKFLIVMGCSVLAVLLATFGLNRVLARFQSRLDSIANEQDDFLNTFSPRYVDLAIFGAAALSLFLELAVIRWQGTVFEFFAFYKNFSLLCCFAGLGLGYALADRRRIPLGATIPLLVWQFGMMIALRFGIPNWRAECLSALPFSEQLNMGRSNVRSLSQAMAIYFFLSVIFLLTVLAFIPIGQLCGRLMERREKLRAYGLNLLGSLAGVVMMLVISWLWTPPVVWFALCFFAILLFYTRKPVPMLLGIGATVAALVILAWPVNPLWGRIYSPYQLLELFQGKRGLLEIRAAGHFYQRIHDLGRSNLNVDSDPELKPMRNYYELPYRIYGKPSDVAIVGAGTGNDVAAALRSGADHVDAIEIDPAILTLGKVNHPERPYQDPRVQSVVNDARSFLRTTDNSYDMVVYGLLDSHTLLSHASSVRLDSFVYTVQGLREARARLKPGGILSLSFVILNDEQGRKTYLMMQQAFEGRSPVCVKAGGSVIFLEAKDKDLVLPTQLLQETGFQEATSFYSNPALQADVSTDDWPFFYMPRRVYPLSYLIMVGLLLVLSFLVTVNFSGERPQFSHAPFFLLGAGFMLVETKGITELGLTFGNSWQVIGIVIAGILIMAFLANWVVQRLRIERPLIPYLLLLASLGLGWYISRSGGLSLTPLGRLETAIVLTCPIFFSGIVFSTLLASRGAISGIMAVNLLGAMCGGLLEYNSMYFGFRALYLIAMVLYTLAFVWELPFLKTQRAVDLQTPPAPASISS
jgi:SAM-dependent methyltransferase